MWAGEDRQRRALRLMGLGFAALAVYLLVQSTIVLASGFHPQHSSLGVAWTAVTAAVMFALAAGKVRTGAVPVASMSRPAGMADVSGTVSFRALAAQAGAVLLTRGMEVEPVAVRGVAAHLVRAAAAGSRMDEEEAVRLVTAEAVADAIVRAVEDAGAKAYHGVRPVRPEKRTVPVTLPASGRLVMAATQAARYAVANEDRALVEHLLDIATEIGAALSGTDTEAAAVEAGSSTNWRSCSRTPPSELKSRAGVSALATKTRGGARWTEVSRRRCGPMPCWPVRCDRADPDPSD